MRKATPRSRVRLWSVVASRQTPGRPRPRQPGAHRSLEGLEAKGEQTAAGKARASCRSTRAETTPNRPLGRQAAAKAPANRPSLRGARGKAPAAKAAPAEKPAAKAAPDEKPAAKAAPKKAPAKKA
jgi:hypothetical protein